MRTNLVSISLTFLIFCLAAGHPAEAQKIELDSVIQKFDKYRKRTLQEKIYLHTDRNFYLVGETMWFKVSCIDATFHRPLDVSKVVYVEVLDHTNKAVQQAKIRIDGGSGHGSMFLPASLATGNYTVRAYTRWMQNFDAAFFFHQSITIANTLSSPEAAISNATSTLDIQFFPEGGNLVAGLESKVAFKVSDAQNKGVDFTGVVINDKGESVATFRSLKFGMGHFVFTPVANTKYSAVIVDSKGLRHNAPFPAINERGWVMRLKENHTAVEISVQANTSEGLIYFFVQTRHRRIKAEAKLIGREPQTFTVSKSELPDGISHFTFFNSKLEPMCERLFFKTPQQQLLPSISGVPTNIGTRQKISLSIGTNVPADLSVAVTRKDSLSLTAPPSILENLFLTSDLRGVIESPSYYFSNTDTLVSAATDNLMLTQGWRRFVWNEVFQSRKEFEHVPEVHGPVITARVKDPQGKPVHGSTVYLASPDKILRVYGAQSNQNGLVQFEAKDFWGAKKIFVQPDGNLDSTSRVELVNAFSEKEPPFTPPVLNLAPTTEKMLLARSVSMQLQNIYYQEETTKVNIPPVDSVAFYGQADETYYLDDYTRFPIMEEVMREYVAGVMVRKRKDHFYFILLDKTNKSVFRENSLILLDGVPIFDVDRIMSFDPLRIKKLDVVNRTYYLGQLTLPGIVSYSTYTGDMAGFPLPQRVLSLDYDGLQVQREFYSPKYEATSRNRVPDHRSLLHWQPVLRTEKDQTATVEFYTSDLTGEFEIVVQGISSDGEVGAIRQPFTVKK